jgi:hypothetical protein
MAITSTQSEASGITNVAIGRYLDTGTVAAFKLTTGFKPRYVCVQNLTATTGLVKVEWYEGMTAGTGLKTAIDGTRSIISTLGITVAVDGFTVGLDTDLVYTSEQLSWMAIG